MVCVTKPSVAGMSAANTRDVVNISLYGETQLQAVADLLLLTSELRPVLTDIDGNFSESYSHNKTSIITFTKGLLVNTGTIFELLHNTAAKWQDIGESLKHICELAVNLIEGCSHAAYLIACSYSGCYPASKGILQPYTLQRSNIDLKLCCQRLKTMHHRELVPSVLVNTCTEIKQHLTALAHCCKAASEKDNCKKSDSEQFKLCIKSFTSSASCLLAAIKTFKGRPSEANHKRCGIFCDSLMASTTATVEFSMDEHFIGSPAILTEDGQHGGKLILSSCLSIASTCIQICSVVRELACDSSSATSREKLKRCMASISRFSTQLVDALRHEEAKMQSQNKKQPPRDNPR